MTELEKCLYEIAGFKESIKDRDYFINELIELLEGEAGITQGLKYRKRADELGVTP